MGLIVIMMVTTSGCFYVHHTRGNYVEEHKVEQIKKGMAQEEVARILGTPTILAPFKDNVWIYYGVKESSIGFGMPTEESVKAVKILFDSEGRVTSVDEPRPIFREVPLSSRKTKDITHKKTVMRSIFGNVGRFNKSSEGIRSRVGAPPGY